MRLTIEEVDIILIGYNYGKILLHIATGCADFSGADFTHNSLPVVALGGILWHIFIIR